MYTLCCTYQDRKVLARNRNSPNKKAKVKKKDTGSRKPMVHKTLQLDVQQPQRLWKWKHCPVPLVESLVLSHERGNKHIHDLVHICTVIPLQLIKL